MQLTGNLVNLVDRTIRYGQVSIENGHITQVTELDAERPGEPYLLPGFVDAHVHVESSMLTPAQFARLAVTHGTVATVSDPHEIGNVLGVAGVEYMIADGKRVPFKFCFGAPSCVPATTFETAGDVIDVADVRRLLEMPEIGYLAEMMNFPGVLHSDPDVMAKIAAAKELGKPIDGHAPGLRSEDAQRYIDAGMTTDHECFTYEEGLDKAQRGMNILIREGSAAKNFEALIPLLAEFPAQIMFCSDDKHPDSLVVNHIDELVRRALAKGHDLFDTLRAACLNPVLHYKLPVGLLRNGDAADFIEVENLATFRVHRTFVHGQVVAENGTSLIPDLRSQQVNQFNCLPKDVTDFAVFAQGAYPLRVIEALDGQLITNTLMLDPTIQDGRITADTTRDILKITVVNRYTDAPPAVAFIRNFGLKKGALASSVGHDSHNIIAVGCDDESLCRAVNQIIKVQGGVCAVSESETHILPLPIAGLMTDADGYAVAEQYTDLDRFVKNHLGSSLQSPFMTLSFMALLVIPFLKLSDRGLFDGASFSFVHSQEVPKSA